jgi:hypothetical protein
LAIQFPATASPEYVHRVLNLVEEVYRGVLEAGIGSMDDEIDRYGSGRFLVNVTSPRHIGEVSALISTLLRKHLFDDDAVVTRTDRAV